MKHRKLATILAFLFLSFSLSACGKDQPVETSAEAEIEAEESEVEEEEEKEEETSETSYYTGYSHYIDPEEAAKSAEDEAETEEEEEGEAADQVDLAEDAVSVTQEETKVVEQAETVTNTPETVTPSSSETASAPAQETYTDTIPETITMDPNFVRCSMYVVYDTQVKDAPYAASGNQGLITRGSNIGVMERCIETGYYRVNYGAKAAYLPPDALSMEDPFK